MRVSGSLPISTTASLSSIPDTTHPQSTEEFISPLDPNRDPRFNRGPDPSTQSNDQDESGEQSTSGASERSNPAENQSDEKSKKTRLPEARPPAAIQRRPAVADPAEGKSSESNESSPAPEIDNESTAQANTIEKIGEETGPDGLTEAERRKVEELKRIDREVRAHEQAHLAAAGAHARGGPQLEFTQGPDGRQYAVGGSVDLDTSKENDPEKTIEKMRSVRQAALAPADPSPQDMKVASQASQKLNEARAEEQREEREQRQGDGQGVEGDNNQTPSDSPGKTDNGQGINPDPSAAEDRGPSSETPDTEFFEDFGRQPNPDRSPQTNRNPGQGSQRITGEAVAENGNRPRFAEITPPGKQSRFQPAEETQFARGGGMDNQPGADQTNPLLFSDRNNNLRGQRLDLVV